MWNRFKLNMLLSAISDIALGLRLNFGDLLAFLHSPSDRLMVQDFNWLKALRWTMSRFLRQLH